MDRNRKTLGALSPSQLNSRVSLAPGRVAADGQPLKKLSLLGGRQSLIGARPQAHNAPSRLGAPAGAGPRRSSTYGKSTSGVKPDPRPLNDKGFQAQCVRCLIAYLSTHGFDQPLSPKLLASPMSKDFAAIVHFLMRKVDPNLNPKSLTKVEDDVPAFFKRLRYPFQISKSSLFAVGSPHTWPGLLASLVWLTELLSYLEKADKAKAALEDERQRAETDFLGYVAESYRHFLAGDDARCEAVDAAKAAEFEARAGEVRAHNAGLQQEVAALQAQVQALQGGASPLAAAKARLAEHTADRDKFRRLIENLQSHRQSLQLKVRERQSDRDAKAEQLAAVEGECRELQARIAAQTFNREDVARMNEERIKREDMLASAEGAREALQRRGREQGLALEQRLDCLEAELQEYNGAADRLQLIPASAKRAGGGQFEARLARGGGASELVNLDFRGAVRAALLRVKDAALARGQALAEEGLALQERLDGLGHGLTERTEEVAGAGAAVRRAERALAAARKAAEGEVRAIQARAEAVRGEVAQLRDATGHSIAASADRVLALQREHEEAAAMAEAERGRVNQDVAAALHALFEHKERLAATLGRTHARVAEAATDVLAAAAV